MEEHAMVDREMADCYLVALEAVAPEDADRMAAAYEILTNSADHEEWAGMMIELLEENGLEV
jgi:hypothetical protein